MGPMTASANQFGPTRHSNPILHAAGLAICLATLFADRPAAAQDFRFSAEAAYAFWLDKPQSDHFTPGFATAFRPGITLGRFVTLQASWSMLHTRDNLGYRVNGSAHSIMGGARFRPFVALQPDMKELGGLFIDGNAGYVRTGDEDRFGFDAGLGYNFQITPWFALGPVVRYGQIVQPDHVDGIDPNDAQFITAGVNVTFGTTRKAPAELVCPEAPECQDEAAEVIPVGDASEPVAQALPPRDRDSDGLLDADDRCPTQAGGAATFGCPTDPCTGAPLLVLVQFPHDSARMPLPRDDDPQTMDPVLDAVAGAIAQDPSCRVCVMGHASEEGPVEYNLDLSEQRAESVSAYMAARGLADRKMPTIGMGAACQLDPEASREMNRRVSFIRLPEGGSCPATCPE